MKTRHSISRYVLVLILMMTAAQQLQAQDAFYIYRNDGDFNGFFFDEIVRMSYSKTDLEGEEHNEYVVQEIETKDSLYRIPLAAIDSIGFQQPEIKINPRVRIIERCELKQYLEYEDYGDAGVHLYFNNLPENLTPKVGDILISVPPSEPDESIYYSHKGYSCVVDEIETNIANNNITGVHGHYVTDPGEVFEQFITVEDITVDPEGNVRRRLAGWNPDKARRSESGGDYATLLDLDFTLNRDFTDPNANYRIALEAQVGVKYKLRATYDIGWTKFYVKLNRHLIVNIEPSAVVALKGEFMTELDDLVVLPEIIFPAACPIFGVNPYPSFFIKAWGEIEARLTFPKVGLDYGEEITFDSGSLFPISYWPSIKPSDEVNNSEVIDVANGSMKFAGHVQAGVKVGCDVGTANWMQKIIKGNVGFYAYIGPELDAQFEYKTDWVEDKEVNLYEALQWAEIDAALLSVNIEAKATLGGFWHDTQEKTFLSKNWRFLCDTTYLVPRFRERVIPFYDKENPLVCVLEMFPKTYRNLYRTELEFGIYESPTFADATYKDYKLVRRVGKTTYYGNAGSRYYYSLSMDDFRHLKGGRSYIVVPLLTWLGYGPYPVWEFDNEFRCPCTMFYDEEQDLRFSANGGELAIEFETNCDKDLIRLNGCEWVEPVRLEAISAEEGQEEKRYRAIFKASRNRELWARELLHNKEIKDVREYQNALGIELGDGQSFYFDAYQEAPDLKNMIADVVVYAVDVSGDHNLSGYYKDKVTATRSGDDHIFVNGTAVSEDDYATNTYTISLDIDKISCDSVTYLDKETNEQYWCTYRSKVSNGYLKVDRKNKDDRGYSTFEARFEIDDKNVFSSHVTSCKYEEHIDTGEENLESHTYYMDSSKSSSAIADFYPQ